MLNVTELSALRADGHRGWRLRPAKPATPTYGGSPAAGGPARERFLDCLHYEPNGPINEWMRMLMTLIRHWESSAGSAVGGGACEGPPQAIGSAL